MDAKETAMIEMSRPRACFCIARGNQLLRYLVFS